MDNPTTQEKIAQLRKSKTNVLRFKKNFIGGYSQDEVQAYIGSLSTNLEQSQRIYSEKIEELTSECAALSQEREKLSKQNRESAAEIKRLNARLNALEQEQDAMLQKQKAAEDALQAARQSHSALVKEHEALVSMNREAKKKAEEALISAEAKIADTAKLSLENERQSTLVKKLTLEIEGLKQAGLTKDDADLAKNFAKLKDANAQLLYENNALKVSAEEQRKRANELREELASQAETINALASAKQKHSMELNMKLYKYKLQLDSHLSGAVSNIHEIEKFLESLKSDTAQMYESTKINIDL